MEKLKAFEIENLETISGGKCNNIVIEDDIVFADFIIFEDHIIL